MADEAEPDHGNDGSGIDLGQADAVGGDRPERSERAGAVADRVGQRHAEGGRDRDQLGVAGVVGTDTGDPRARVEAADSGAHLPDGAHARVAGSEGVVEPGPNRIQGGTEAVAGELLEDALGIGGPFPGLAEQALRRDPRKRALRAGGDQRAPVGDDQAARLGNRVRKIHDFDRPTLETLHHLPHDRAC